MSQFLTVLNVDLVSDATNDGRGTWRLNGILMYQSDAAGKLIIVPAGFETDFASVPPLALFLTGEGAHSASTVHDYLYTTHQVDRTTADAVLREAALVSGMSKFRAFIMWAGVRVFGGTHWN